MSCSVSRKQLELNRFCNHLVPYARVSRLRAGASRTGKVLKDRSPGGCDLGQSFLGALRRE